MSTGKKTFVSLRRLLESAMRTGCGQNRDEAVDAGTKSPEAHGDSDSRELLGQLDLSTPDEAVSKALTEACALVQRHPESAESWGRLGMLLLAHDFFESAAKCLAKAARLDRVEPRWPYFESIAIRSLNPDRLN